jgi:hypothetical protein
MLLLLRGKIIVSATASFIFLMEGRHGGLLVGYSGQIKRLSQKTCHVELVETLLSIEHWPNGLRQAQSDNIAGFFETTSSEYMTTLIS